VISVEAKGLLVAIGISAVLTFFWLLKADRSVTYHVLYQHGFRAMRVRMYLSVAGILWMVTIVLGMLSFGVLKVMQPTSGNGEMALWITLLLLALVVPLLIMRSVVLSGKYKK
jgi:hypothetical protein